MVATKLSNLPTVRDPLELNYKSLIYRVTSISPHVQVHFDPIPGSSPLVPRRFGLLIGLCLQRPSTGLTEKIPAEKIESFHQGHNRQHNDGNNSFLGSLLGLPVELSNGIAG